MTFQAIIIFFALPCQVLYSIFSPPFLLSANTAISPDSLLYTPLETFRAQNVPCAEKRGKTAAYVMFIVDGDDIVIYFTNLFTSEIARV